MKRPGKERVLIVVALLIVMSLLPAHSFAIHGESNHSQLLPTSLSSRKQSIGDDSRISTTNASETKILYSLLATGRDKPPNRGNFFFNDEVSSHLYGYMYLVGFFFAQDPLFLASFFLFSAVAAWATQESLLPANPRVPALTSVATLATTMFGRFGMGLDPPLQDLIGGIYHGPTQDALLLEVGISSLNVLWGVFGTWKAKEQKNGATYGF
ncbi:hypothetical protein IV203_019752 [Nitzschia inconspicua]|uniref:Uncharacterized protein n=1 Tax=Nitzschia inconspicua TaxID=303405 RepID=A0A9K3LZS0_9STRA|nr:hypothetical protein IV203_019752 [Nitzschia inconspicua]